MPVQVDLFFQKLLTKTITSKAADLILTVGNLPSLKVDQKLVVLEDFEVVTPDLLNSFLDDILDEQEKKELSEKKSLSCAKDFQEEMRFRINIFYQKGYPSLEMRYITPIIAPLSDYNFPKVVTELYQIKTGLIIIGGPYGSGRSTVVSSFLDVINQKQSKHVITIEQPIEYLLTSSKSVVEQREVGSDVESFLTAIKNLRDIDVDVVYVSQVSGAEEVEALIEVVEGGRLVFLVMEGESVDKILAKLVDLFDLNEKDRILHSLADLLKCVLVLRLLAKIGGGTILVSEIMMSNQATSALIREGRFFQLLTVIPTSRQEGMRSLDQSLAELVMNGKVDLSQAEINALDKNNLRSLIKR